MSAVPRRSARLAAKAAAAPPAPAEPVPPKARKPKAAAAPPPPPVVYQPSPIVLHWRAMRASYAAAPQPDTVPEHAVLAAIWTGIAALKEAVAAATTAEEFRACATAADALWNKVMDDAHGEAFDDCMGDMFLSDAMHWCRDAATGEDVDECRQNALSGLCALLPE
jgi:hypothetical protein